MFRTNPTRLVELWTQIDEIRGDWHDYAQSAVGAIAVLSPAVRAGRSNAAEAAEKMMWTVGQCVSLGDTTVEDDLLNAYRAEEILAFRKAVDAVVRDALILFGVAGIVLETLERMQGQDEPFIDRAMWERSIRAWWVSLLSD